MGPPSRTQGNWIGPEEHLESVLRRPRQAAPERLGPGRGGACGSLEKPEPRWGISRLIKGLECLFFSRLLLLKHFAQHFLEPRELKELVRALLLSQHRSRDALSSGLPADADSGYCQRQLRCPSPSCLCSQCFCLLRVLR